MNAEQLEQGPHEDVNARSEHISPEERVLMGAAGLCEVVKEGDELFEQHLELPRNHFKLRYHEYPDNSRENKERPAHYQR